MARRLNTRQLALMLIFIGVPVVLLVLAARGCLFASGNPQPYYEEAKKHVENAENLAASGDKSAASAEWVRAWEPANMASRYGPRNPDIQYLLARVAMQQNPPVAGRAIGALRATLLYQPIT